MMNTRTFSFSHGVLKNLLLAGPLKLMIVWLIFILLFTTTQMYLPESLTHYQTTNFGLFHTERVCRRQFQIPPNWQKVFPGASKVVIVWEWVNTFTKQQNVDLDQIESICRQQS